MSFDLKNKTVTIIGAARSGIAAANTVIRPGGKAKITEFKSRQAIDAEVRLLEHPDQVQIECGGHTREFIRQSDYVVISPGVRSDISAVLWAKEAGIEVMGEIEFAYRLCTCPIIAVTGSNGKTTTVTLITEILAKAGRSPVLCGNIGSPFSKHVTALNQQNTVVLEISSFQLESCLTFKPHIALWLNFSQNHLDRHKDTEEYFQAKRKIFQNQGPEDFAVLNFKQDVLRDLAPKLKSKTVFYNGPDAPADIEHPNFLAALAVAKILGIKEDMCRDVFAHFKGVEHRQEMVRTLDGVDYINDSKSTTPEAGQWALTHIKKPMVMICGGSDKHLSFAHLRDLVKAKVKRMIVIGETKDVLRETFQDLVPLVQCLTLQDAVEAARSAAKAGDCVVLSPMCASFDMFKDYEHRGREFKNIVNGLK